MKITVAVLVAIVTLTNIPFWLSYKVGFLQLHFEQTDPVVNLSNVSVAA